MNILLCYLLLINPIAFFACFADKRFAIRHKRRISERTLLLLCALGGAFLFLLGMLCFHHKTRKPLFFVCVPLLCIGWVVLLVFLTQQI